jgi:hypothetical protein
MEVVKTAMSSCARNDVFPIHVNFNDDEADMRTSKPGGYFCKALYSENGSDKGEAEPGSAAKSRKGGRRAAALEAAAGGSAEEPGSGALSGHDDDEFDVERELNGGEDAGYHGFCRTER